MVNFQQLYIVFGIKICQLATLLHITVMNNLWIVSFLIIKLKIDGIGRFLKK